MKTSNLTFFVVLFAFISLLGCNTNPGSSIENGSEETQEITEIGDQEILMRLKGRIDFSDGTYYESYDKERTFKIPTREILNINPASEASSGDMPLVQEGQCVQSVTVFPGGEVTISGMSSVTFTRGTTQLTKCHTGTSIRFRPQAWLKGNSSGVINSRIKWLSSGDEYYSGNTDFYVNSTSQFTRIDGSWSSTHSIGLYENWLNELEISIFNDQTSSLTCNGAQIQFKRYDL